MAGRSDSLPTMAGAQDRQMVSAHTELTGESDLNVEVGGRQGPLEPLSFTNSRVFYAIVVLCFSVTCGYATVLPSLWPLMQHLGAGHSEYAVAAASFSSGAFCGMLLLGSLADYLSPKPILLAATALSSVGCLMYCIPLDSSVIYPARFFWGIAVGTWSVVLATTRRYSSSMLEISKATTVASQAQTLGYIAGPGMAWLASLVRSSVTVYSGVEVQWLLPAVFTGLMLVSCFIAMSSLHWPVHSDPSCISQVKTPLKTWFIIGLQMVVNCTLASMLAVVESTGPAFTITSYNWSTTQNAVFWFIQAILGFGSATVLTGGLLEKWITTPAHLSLELWLGHRWMGQSAGSIPIDSHTQGCFLCICIGPFTAEKHQDLDKHPAPLPTLPKETSLAHCSKLAHACQKTAAEMSMKSDSTLLSKSRSPSFPRIKAVADQIQNASAPAVTAVAATTTKEVKQRPAPLPIIDAPMLPDSLIIEPLNQEANAHAVGTPPTEVSTAAAPAEEEVKPKPAALPILPDSLIAQPQIQEPRADVGTAAGMAAKPNPVILPDPDANMALRTSLLPPSNNEQRADVGLATRTLTRQSSNTSGCSNVSIGVDEYLASRPADLYLSPSSALRALDTSQSPYSGRKASAPASGNATPPNVISQKRHQSISSGSPLSIAVPSPSQRSNSIGSTPYQAPPSPLSPLLQSQWYQPYYTTAYYPSTPMTSYQVPSTTTAYRYYPASYVEPGGIPSIPTMYSSSVPLEQYRSSQFATIAFPSHGVPMQCSPPSSGTPSPANRTSSDPSPRLAPASWVSYGTRITHSS